MDTHTLSLSESIVQAFLSDERFSPAVPKTFAEAGLSESLVEALACKYLAVTGIASGRTIADMLCLPFRLLEGLLANLRTRQVLVHTGAAPFNDYYYTLTDSGRQRATTYQRACAYVGPAPVTLADYCISVQAQCISAESPTDADLKSACADITCDETLFERIGPAVNSGAGMFLFGAPGNGKSTLARRITGCFGEEIWIPRTIIEDDQLITLFDSACHHEVKQDASGPLKAREFDRRWVRIRRPTVSVGGELTLDNLELRHDPLSKISEAPLQMKSNAGCLLIDDFGRQRIKPAELLNRWIIPLEMGKDFLTLPSGKKIQVPFDQLIIFSTNLEPRDLVDEAFLRRIPYKIEVGDPTEAEFYELFELYATQMGCAFDPAAVNYLLETHYHPHNRPLRRCHPRDLLKQIRSYCRYRRFHFEMLPDYIDRVVASYFSTVLGET